MSNLQSKMTGVKFAAVPERPAVPGDGALIFGVVYPALVVALELATRMCAQAFFDALNKAEGVVARARRRSYAHLAPRDFIADA